MSNRTIFNELGESRVINPRSGFSQFVDLSNNQTISGIKRFLSNLITNANVNFNTTTNERRIVFQPNEPYGYGGSLLTIYAAPGPTDPRGWYFDANGSLYCIGTGLYQVTISFSEGGSITAGATSFTSIDLNNGDITSGGIIDCTNLDATLTIQSPIIYVQNTLYTDKIQSYTGGSSITFLSNLALGSQTITTTGNITGGLITGTSLSIATITTSGNVNFNTSANIGRIVFKPNEPIGVGKIVSVYTTNETIGYGWFFDANGYLYYKDNIIRIYFGPSGNISCQDITCGTISAASLGCAFISTTSTITANGILQANAGLNATTGSFSSNVTITGATGLTITGVSNGIFTNRINAQSGGIISSTSQFSISSTLSATTISATTSLKTNLIEPYTGTVINIGATSEFNFLKAVGVSRIRLYPTSTAGDIMQITRVSDATFTSGYWYFNNTGNLGYSTGGGSVWELSNNGDMNYGNRIIFTPSIGVGEIAIFRTVVSGSGRWHFSTNSNFGYWNGSSHIIYIEGTSGNITCGTINCGTINAGSGTISTTGNINGARLVCTNYIQCLGQYIYNEHSSTGDICGLWSNRPFGATGGGLFQNSNNWVCMGGLENNNNANIAGGGFNSGGQNRVFTWMIENTANSGKALGLAVNRVNAPNSYINTGTQSTGFALLGYFATNKAGGAYSFTGEHSSMVCDEEYDDLMNYNTDDFIGMVVCSSGKIYNLPYDVDGNTYTKQVDNIKPVDSQPMTRLSKKYKDKSVLGVISHIERIGKNRNDLNATSWTGCMALDKDERRRIRIASIGEGGIWITNEYGNIENGDYITTSKIAGYSTKQDTDFLMNYTIGKATMDCDFDIEKPDDYKTKYLGDGIYASYCACIFYCG